MKIKEVNLILNDSNMQEKECNFKIIDKKKSAPEWFLDFEKRLNSRFDNLIKKNHLIE